LFIEKVEKGLQDAEEGKTMSLHEAKMRMEKKWQAPLGVVPYK